VGITREKESLQEEWKLNIMCPIHKKGDKSNCRTTEACCYYVQLTELASPFQKIN
jgi:hypothetical protein